MHDIANHSYIRGRILAPLRVVLEHIVLKTAHDQRYLVEIKWKRSSNLIKNTNALIVEGVKRVTVRRFNDR